MSVSDDPAPDAVHSIEPGIALCLSGGGYRAMIFHIGAVIRLNEAGLLGRLTRVSSVSGGSLTAGLLGWRWGRLSFVNGVATALDAEVVQPLRQLARQTLDAESVLGGIFSSDTIAERIAKEYDRLLFHGATLQNLPADGQGPRFIINATNVQTGSLWRFSRPYMADYRVGCVPNPDVPLCQAVGASSAFPPFLSPARLDLDPARFDQATLGPLGCPPYTERAVLSDGGVYDNLGLEPAWKRIRTLLVSDGGGQMAPEEKPRSDWAQHLYRIMNIVDNQVRSLRKRTLIEAFERGTEHDGTFWGIRTAIADYRVADPLPCLPECTSALAAIPTRLAAMDDETQERLINWGYAVCDAALRRHLGVTLDTRRGFPYPRGVR